MYIVHNVLNIGVSFAFHGYFIIMSRVAMGVSTQNPHPWFRPSPSGCVRTHT